MMTLFVEEVYHTINLQAGLSDFLEVIHHLMCHKLSHHIILHDGMIRIIQGIDNKLHAYDTQLIIMPMEIPNV